MPVYKDTPANRKLGRVGLHWGAKKSEAVLKKQKQSAAKELMKALEKAEKKVKKEKKKKKAEKKKKKEPEEKTVAQQVFGHEGVRQTIMREKKKLSAKITVDDLVKHFKDIVSTLKQNPNEHKKIKEARGNYKEPTINFRMKEIREVFKYFVRGKDYRKYDLDNEAKKNELRNALKRYLADVRDPVTGGQGAGIYGLTEKAAQKLGWDKI